MIFKSSCDSLTDVVHHVLPQHQGPREAGHRSRNLRDPRTEGRRTVTTLPPVTITIFSTFVKLSHELFKITFPTGKPKLTLGEVSTFHAQKYLGKNIFIYLFVSPIDAGSQKCTQGTPSVKGRKKIFEIGKLIFEIQKQVLCKHL